MGRDMDCIVVHSAEFLSLHVGRFSHAVTGSLNLYNHVVEVEYTEDNLIVQRSLIATSCVTGLDLQVQGLSEGTTYLPLTARLTIEFDQPLPIWIKGTEYRSMILSLKFDLDTVGELKSIVQRLQEYHGRKLKHGLPPWASWVPGYSPRRRRIIQTVLLLWTIFSVIWAFFQLYQHFKLFREVIAYVSDIIRLKFKPVWNVVHYLVGNTMYYVKAVLHPYLDPLHVLFVTASTPVLRIVSFYWSICKSVYQLLYLPLYAFGNGIYMVLSAVLSPFLVIYQYISAIFGAIGRSLLVPANTLWQFFRVPILSLWMLIRIPGILLYELIFSILLPKIKAPLLVLYRICTNLVSKASRFEYDVQKERIAKIQRFAQRKSTNEPDSKVKTM